MIAEKLANLKNRQDASQILPATTRSQAAELLSVSPNEISKARCGPQFGSAKSAGIWKRTNVLARICIPTMGSRLKNKRLPKLVFRLVRQTVTKN
jgi:hypothetical protein